jgi:RES domain-containing protein
MPVDVDPVRVTGRWYRHAYPGAAPLTERDPPPDGRWQRGDVVDALYLADTRETAWAEWYRHLAELGVPPRRQLPRDLWTWEIDAELADLSAAACLARTGLGVPRPGRRGWPAFQAIGEALHADGWPGLLAPSAARAGGTIVCLFRHAGRVPAATPLRPPERVSEAPVPPRDMRT